MRSAFRHCPLPTPSPPALPIRWQRTSIPTLRRSADLVLSRASRRWRARSVKPHRPSDPPLESLPGTPSPIRSAHLPQGEGEESLLQTLSYESAGFSMQDGETDTMQQTLPSSSSACVCCTSEMTRPLEEAHEPSALPLCANCGSCLKHIGGTGPGKRAGHTATAVGRRSVALPLLPHSDRIFFIGGGFGSDYVQTIHILDTDAPPTAVVRSEPSSNRIQVSR
jgi:hypothetical protein